VEEFTSHHLEEEFAEMLHRIENLPEDRRYNGETGKLFFSLLENEKFRRKEENFQLILKDGAKEKEQYIYFMGQYKKIIASVLYLEIIREKANQKYIQMIGGTAAFAASVLYFYLMLMVSRSFAINSLPFILALSIGYVFKDRLKEITKLILNPKVLSYFPDHITQILDHSEKLKVPLGEIREKMFYTDRDKADPVVMAMRDKTRPTVFLPEYAPEDMMVYQKEIIINTEAIRERHTRTINITDIMRFNIRKFLDKMDEPNQNIYYYHQDDGAYSTTGDRTYHINMVIKYSKHRQKRDQLRYERYRIVADKFGIRRIEFVEQM